MAKLSSTQIYGDLQVDGEIKNKATTTTEGVVQLSSATNSTSTTLAATASAVKAAYDLAAGKAAASHTHNYAGSSSAGGAATSALACTGNSVTATTLQTARTINGTSFNGSANITTANWGTARTITIGSTGKSVNGSANVAWTLAEIGAAASSHTHNAITSRGNVTMETGANVRPAVAGLSMAQVYNNGYPTSYGNVISLRGAGDGQILVGWSGTSGGHAPVYVRSRRDTTDADWSGWAQVYTSANPQTTISGNAGTATKLQTARTITIGNSSKTFDGSDNISWTASEIGAGGLGIAGTGTNAEIFNYSSNVASGSYSHAEGYNTAAKGSYCHAEGNGTIASYSSSHAEGNGTTASGNSAHAEGISTTASGQNSHAEGNGTIASAMHSHAEGFKTKASSNYAHSEGGYTLAYGQGSHAEGAYTTAKGSYSHAEGYSYGIADMTNTSVTGTNENDIFNYWTGLASNKKFLLAWGTGSHCEGKDTLAVGSYSHAEGHYTVARGTHSHAEGYSSMAKGSYSHAEGWNNDASGTSSHAEGVYTTTTGAYTHAEGYRTTAETFIVHVQGQYNKVNDGSTSSYAATNNAFVIGNGTSSSAKSNAFRVDFSGKTYGLSAFNSTGADYAEYFEWLDGNQNNEDRIGHFVALEGEKIRFANSEDDYIIGIISGNQSIIGNACEDSWNDMYIRDKYGRLQYEDVEVEVDRHQFNEETNETEIFKEKVMEKHIKLNPDYDPSIEYKPRSERKEWGIVGMLGQIIVKDDGTCKINGFCKPSKNGIATASDNKAHYRVMARIDENLIKVIMK